MKFITGYGCDESGYIFHQLATLLCATMCRDTSHSRRGDIYIYCNNNDCKLDW